MLALFAPLSILQVAQNCGKLKATLILFLCGIVVHESGVQMDRWAKTADPQSPIPNHFYTQVSRAEHLLGLRHLPTAHLHSLFPLLFGLSVSRWRFFIHIFCQKNIYETLKNSTKMHWSSCKNINKSMTHHAYTIHKVLSPLRTDVLSYFKNKYILSCLKTTRPGWLWMRTFLGFYFSRRTPGRYQLSWASLKAVFFQPQLLCIFKACSRKLLPSNEAIFFTPRMSAPGDRLESLWRLLWAFLCLWRRRWAGGDRRPNSGRRSVPQLWVKANVEV